MDMTIADYEALITRLERSAARHPGVYKVKVVALALLGYSYIFGVLSVLLVVVLGVGALVMFKPILLAKIGFKLIAPLAIVVWVCAKAIWVRIEEPDGRRLARAEAPELFAEIDRIRKELGAPRVHEVIITEEFNAAVTQMPRLGLFGFQKNFLILGLPLMMSLSLEEFRAVVAHELGHLSGSHSKFGAWIYRLRLTWFRIQASFQHGENASMLFNRFFSWFVPYFGAYSFVLARQNEYEADRSAADLAGAPAAGRALVKTHVLGDYLGERFWPELIDRNDRQEQPPRQLFAEMHAELNKSVDTADAELLLTSAMQRKTGFDDTHPSLSDRLTALGVDAELPPPTETSAGEELLSGMHEALTEAFSRDWFEAVHGKWRQIYAESRAGSERLDELGALREERALEDEELWEFASLTERFRGEERALELFRAYLDDHPDDADAHAVVGRLLLSQGDERGMSHIEIAVQHNRDHIPYACSAAVNFYFGEDRRAEAQRWIDRHDVYQQQMAAASRERDQLEPDDVFFDAMLDTAQLDKLRRQLEMYPTIKKAYLVCKDVEHFPEHPLYVLGIEVKTGLFGAKKEARALIQMIVDEVAFPGETFVVNLKGSELRWLRKKLKRIPGAQIL